MSLLLNLIQQTMGGFVMNNVVVCLFLLISIGLILGGCERSQFSLPAGDAEAGRATFVILQCNECHSVEGVQYAGNTHHEINVLLGGKTTRVKSYEDLVTSIIHPSHKLSRGLDPKTITEKEQSMMRTYNEFMTVEELINLVTFLQASYEIWIPESDKYVTP
jgi:hypothetical protein